MIQHWWKDGWYNGSVLMSVSVWVWEKKSPQAALWTSEWKHQSPQKSWFGQGPSLLKNTWKQTMNRREKKKAGTGGGESETGVKRPLHRQQTNHTGHLWSDLRMKHDEAHFSYTLLSGTKWICLSLSLFFKALFSSALTVTTIIKFWPTRQQYQLNFTLNPCIMISEIKYVHFW